METTARNGLSDRTPASPSAFDRARRRRERARATLDGLINVLEAVASECHELTHSVQLRVCDLNPADRPGLEERARKLARIRDLADVTLAALAGAGVEPTAADHAPPLVLLGPGPGYRTQLPSEPLGQRLDLEA